MSVDWPAAATGNAAGWTRTEGKFNTPGWRDSRHIGDQSSARLLKSLWRQ